MSWQCCVDSTPHRLDRDDIATWGWNRGSPRYVVEFEGFDDDQVVVVRHWNEEENTGTEHGHFPAGLVPHMLEMVVYQREDGHVEPEGVFRGGTVTEADPGLVELVLRGQLGSYYRHAQRAWVSPFDLLWDEQEYRDELGCGAVLEEEVALREVMGGREQDYLTMGLVELVRGVREAMAWNAGQEPPEAGGVSDD